MLRTIFGSREGAHVHSEGWKHGNEEVRLNMACTCSSGCYGCYGAQVHVQLGCGCAYRRLNMVRFVLNV